MCSFGLTEMTIRRITSAENGLKTGCRATKKDRLTCPFDQGEFREIGLAGQNASLRGNSHRFGPGSNSQISIKIFNMELNGAKAQE